MSKWIIGIHNSECDGIDFLIFEGTEEEAKKYLYFLIAKERIQKAEENNLNDFEFGTEAVEELSFRENSFYGFNNYMDYHVDYEMQNLDLIKTVK